MSLGLLTDGHVPLAITRGLRRRGIDVLTAQEDGAATFPDDLLLDRAAELNRILFTQDEDFLVEVAARRKSNRPHATVVYGHQFEPIGVCVSDLEIILKSLLPQERVGCFLRIPL
jgi:predicted nuclease of predicted toxin-antitoxin system